MNFMEYTTLNVEDKDKTSRFENIALYFIVGVMFLLPIFFIPSLSVPFSFTKSLLIFVSVLIAFFLFLISKLKTGEIVLPRNKIALIAWALPATYLFSAMFSGNSGISYLGQGFEIDTFSFITIMVLMLSLVPLLLKTKESVFKIHIALVFSFGILVLFQGLRIIFGADFLSFGIFTTATSNLLGKWNDFGIFLGLTSILSLITLEGLTLNKILRLILYIILGVSMLFLAIINFFSVWVTVGLFALGLFVFSVSKNILNPNKNNQKNIEIPLRTPRSKAILPSIIILIISIVFIISGSSLGNYLNSKFNTTQIEARPSWQSTVDIMKQTYKDNMLFGSGPNTFKSQWTQLKPQSINNTLFWNIDFSSGVGIIPTSFVTTGLIGVFAWIAFFLFLLYSGFKNLIVSAIEDKASYYLSLSLFLGAMYLWVFTIIYIPNVVIVTLAFLLTGMYIASLRHRPSAPIEKEISFASNPRIGFISVLILIILLIVSAVSLYVIGGQYISAISFQSSLVSANIDGNIDEAERKLEKALRFGKSDKYYRFMSEIKLARINQVISDEGKTAENKRSEFQIILASAISNAQKAIQVDNENYQNWTMLGRVYGSVVPLQVEGAYDRAKQSYDKAIELHPNSPEIFLTLAQLELAKDKDNTKGAKEFIGKALEKKDNYTEAIFLLSQIQIQEGNIQNAIKSVEAVAVIEPNNPVFFFQLGLLQSNAGDKQKATFAFERAVALNPQYSNARYFLGLNYFNDGKIKEATEQFDIVSQLNPENEEIKTILENLKAGNNPFPKTSDKSKKIKALPIEGE